MRPQRPCRQPHGTTARYASGCSCPECCEAWRLYQAAKPRRIPAEYAEARIRYLGQGGVSLRRIAKASGKSRSTLHRILHGGVRHVARDTYEAILGVALTAAP